MATAAHRERAAHGGVLRWTRAVGIALVAVLAVLVHHETATPVTHVPPARASGTSSLAGMDHSPASVVSVAASGHAESLGITAPIASHDHGACSGTTMEGCSAAGVDSVKLAPPHHPATGCAPALSPHSAAGRDVPGTTGRAPPDLSALSRLLL
ncbi:hypothetical protein [Streptomyces canus]|uniref:hypothetical protein n=1 Tax=Streptomyces canus TaxID=58343 RepID=UPI0036ED87A8